MQNICLHLQILPIDLTTALRCRYFVKRQGFHTKDLKIVACLGKTESDLNSKFLTHRPPLGCTLKVTASKVYLFIFKVLKCGRSIGWYSLLFLTYWNVVKHGVIVLHLAGPQIKRIVRLFFDEIVMLIYWMILSKMGDTCKTYKKIPIVCNPIFH